MFTELGRAIRGEVVLHLFHAEIAPQDGEQGQSAELLPQQPGPSGGNGGNLQYESGAATGSAAIAAAGGEAIAPSGGGTQTIQASPHEKLGRNEPCWCGSGKKFKKCHGA
jgi:preprotein translocase subunit SecA